MFGAHLGTSLPAVIPAAPKATQTSMPTSGDAGVVAVNQELQLLQTECLQHHRCCQRLCGLVLFSWKEMVMYCTMAVLTGGTGQYWCHWEAIEGRRQHCGGSRQYWGIQSLHKESLDNTGKQWELTGELQGARGDTGELWTALVVLEDVQEVPRWHILSSFISCSPASHARY